jgi:hypothetical protein
MISRMSSERKEDGTDTKSLKKFIFPNNTPL